MCARWHRGYAYHHFPSRPLFFRQEGILLVTGIQMGVKEAAVYRAYSYAALSVQLCCTLGARWLHFSGTIFSFTYAGLSVYLCCTIGIPMLDLWYQNALLFWYRFFNLFTSNIKAN